MKYVKAAEVTFADAISRVSPQPAPLEGEFPQLDIHIKKNLPASPTKLQQIRKETANDPALSKLRDWSDTWRVACDQREMPQSTPQLLELPRGNDH